jgi:hypothetical protein
MRNVTLLSMSHIAGTMPEPRLQKTKKRAQAVRSIPPSQRTNAVEDTKTAPAVIVKPEVAVKTEKVKKAQHRRSGDAIASWWPVAVGMFLCGFAPEWHAMAVQAGIWAERTAFPLTLLATHREIGIDNQMANVLPQAALYLQLPLEGLLTKLTLDRGRSLKAAIMQLVLVHGIAAFVLWLISFSAR